MASVYELRTFEDILDAACEELGISSTDTTAINRAKRDINITYQKVLAFKRWNWLQKSVDLTLPAYVSSGTVSVTAGSATVTLSTAPTSSKKGYYFAVDGYAEIYTIESHAASSTTVKLETEYTGTTDSDATYRIWTDRIPLPTNCRETVTVRHDFRKTELDGVGPQEYRRLVAGAPRAEARPSFYYTDEYKDPAQTSSITSLPALTSRASAGTIKTLVFASTLPTGVTSLFSSGVPIEPIRWNVSAAGSPTYNGPVLIASLSTTTNTNDTVTYVGRGELTESATSDSTMSITQLDQEVDYERQRQLWLFPSEYSSKTTMHVDYIQEGLPLKNDADEPIVPLEDRDVILYGALERGWRKRRNPEESSNNGALYREKLAEMSGRLQDTHDNPKLKVSNFYLNAKRGSTRTRQLSESSGDFGGSSGGQHAVTGTAGMVAQFNATTGEIEAASTVSNTELTVLNDMEPVTSVTLTDATTTTAASWAYASYDSIQLEYSLERGSGNEETGRIAIKTDGTNVGIAVGGVAGYGTTGVTWSADISGSSVRLRATLSSTGANAIMTYRLSKWQSA